MRAEVQQGRKPAAEQQKAKAAAASSLTVRDLAKDYRAKKLVRLEQVTQVEEINDRHTCFEERREALGKWAEALAAEQGAAPEARNRWAAGLFADFVVASRCADVDRAGLQRQRLFKTGCCPSGCGRCMSSVGTIGHTR